MNHTFWKKLSHLAIIAAFSTGAMATEAFAQKPATQKSDAGKQAKANSKSGNKTAKSKAGNSKSPKNSKEEDRQKSRDAFNEIALKVLDALNNEQYATALVYCEQAMAQMPEFATDSVKENIYSMCMQLYERNKQLDKALELAEIIKRLNISEESRNSLCFKEAILLTQKHLWEDAKAKYTTCKSDTASDQALIASNLAELEMILEQPDLAVEKYKQSLAISTEHASTLFGISVALSRTGRWDEAMQYFLQGVENDPGFGYLKYEFFEPAAENDYQTAYRMIALHRPREAKFYLDRYIQSELRPKYRDLAIRERDRLNEALNSGNTAIKFTQPALLDHINAVAIDQSGTKLAFASLQRTHSSESINSYVWIMDLETGEVSKRMEVVNDVITKMMFINDTPKLRIAAIMNRYELDASNPKSGYFIYKNPPSSFVMDLDGEEDMVSFTADHWLTMSPWLNPYMQIPLIKLPHEARTAAIAYNHRSLFLDDEHEIGIYSVETGEIIKSLSKSFYLSSADAHPQKPLFALGIRSGTLLVDSKGNFQALLGSPELEGVSAVAFSPDGRWLATVSGTTVEVWDVEKSMESH